MEIIAWRAQKFTLQRDYMKNLQKLRGECAYHFFEAVDCFRVVIHITHIYIYI